MTHLSNCKDGHLKSRVATRMPDNVIECRAIKS